MLENDNLVYNEIEDIVKTKTFILFGDFNLPHLNSTIFASDNEGYRLLKLINKLYLSQFVSKPSTYNILDIILATVPI